MQTVSDTAPQYRGETRKLFRPRPSKRFLVNTSHLLYFFKSLLGPIMKVMPTGLHSRQLICFSPTGSSDIMWLLEWFCSVPRWIMDRGEKRAYSTWCRHWESSPPSPGESGSVLVLADLICLNGPDTFLNMKLKIRQKSSIHLGLLFVRCFLSMYFWCHTYI